MVPFDKTKPLIAMRMDNTYDPMVKPTVRSLPSAPINRNKDEAIWLTINRRRNCLKSLR